MRTPFCASRTAVKAAARHRPRTVKIERGLRFLANVEHVRRLGLHAVGHLHRLDDRLHLLIGPGLLLAHLLELFQ